MIKHKAFLEITWWIFTLVLVGAIIYPIWNRLPDYPFLVANIIFWTVFITFTRYIFQLQHTFIATLQPVKIILVFLCFYLGIYLINQLNYTQTFLDEQGWDAVVGNLPYEDRNTMIRYIRSQLLLSGVGSAITTVILPVRLIISIWRWRNKGTV